MWLNPYLNFGGQAREAFEFYQSIFGGKLDLVDGKAFGMPEEQHDRIMHAHLETEGGWSIMGSDGRDNTGEFAGFYLNIGGPKEDLETARTYYAALAEDGVATMPLETQQWGDTYGQVVDKYGVTWSFNF